MALDKHLAHRLKLEYLERTLNEPIDNSPLVDFVTVKQASGSIYHHEVLSLSTELTTKVEKMCNGAHLPLYSFYLTIWALLVHKYNKSTSLLIAASSFTLQPEDKEADTMTLIKTTVNPQIDFRSNYFMVKESVVKAYAYQGLSLEELNSYGPNSKIHTAFTFEEGRPSVLGDRFDMHIQLNLRESSVVLNYYTNKFSSEFIAGLLNNYKSMLREFGDNLDRIPDVYELQLDYRKSIEIMQAEEGDFNFDF